MDRKARTLITAVGILLVVLAVYMLVIAENQDYLVTAKDQNKPVMDKNPMKYLFVEARTIKNGTAISGESKFGKYFIDGPGYYLSGSNLRSSITPELDSSVKAIYGSYYELSGDAGSGASGSMDPIRDLPYTDGNVSILDIQGDKVTLSYDNNSISLLPGDSWKNETHQIEKSDYGVQNVITATVIYNRGKVTVTPIGSA